MKPAPKILGNEQKKVGSAPVLQMGSAVAAGASVTSPSKSESVFDSPSKAVWDRYVDSRMKHFGTR